MHHLPTTYSVTDRNKRYIWFGADTAYNGRHNKVNIDKKGVFLMPLDHFKVSLLRFFTIG